MGSSILNICPNSPRLVQAVCGTHKAWPENVLFDKIDPGGSEMFYLIALSLFAWASSLILWNASPSLLVEHPTSSLVPGVLLAGVLEARWGCVMGTGSCPAAQCRSTLHVPPIPIEMIKSGVLIAGRGRRSVRQSSQGGVPAPSFLPEYHLGAGVRSLSFFVLFMNK